MVWIDNSQGIDWVSNTDETTDEPIPTAMLILGDRGAGKSMFSEGVQFFYYKQGFTMITLMDAKDDIEAGFSMFEVEKDYHKRLLRRTGCPMMKIPTIIYHPLTLNIDENKEYPEFNWFSIDIKSLNRIDLGFLAETEKNTTAITILLETIKALKDSDGIHHLVFYADNKTENITNLNKKGIKLRSDKPEDFFSRSKMGTEKTSGEILKYFSPFLDDYSITPHNYERNLDIVKIINDQKHYHVFTYKHIKDKRLKAFYILHILQEILKHKDEMKYKIMIRIPELKFMLPQKSDGFTVFLAQAVSDMIATMRSNGIGIISDTQVMSDTNSIVTNVMNEQYIGKMTSLKEYDYIGKALKLGKTEIDKMKSLRIGEWLCKITSKTSQESKLEKMNAYLPPHAHKEVFEKFEEKYTKTYPEKMQKIEPIIKELNQLKKKIEEEVHKLVEAENSTKKTIIKQQIRERQKPKGEEKKEVKTIENLEKKKGLDKAIWNEWKKEYEIGIEGQSQSYKTIADRWSIKLGYKINKKYVERKIKTITDETIEGEEDEAIGQENGTPLLE